MESIFIYLKNYLLPSHLYNNKKNKKPLDFVKTFDSTLIIKSLSIQLLFEVVLSLLCFFALVSLYLKKYCSNFIQKKSFVLFDPLACREIIT